MKADDVMTTEYAARLGRLIHARGMSPRAARIVVDAAMYGIGCVEGEFRARAEKQAQEKKPTS